jgi:CheY-specific phosphatase CheX
MTGSHNPPLAFNEKVAQALNCAIEGTLNDAFQMTAHPQGWSVGRNMPMDLKSDVVCLMDIKQEEISCGTFIVALDRAMVNKIVTQTGGIDGDVKMIDDAAGEITNMIYGMFKTAMNKSGYHLAIGLPTTPHEATAVEKYDEAEKMMVPFEAEGHHGQVVVTQTT